MRELRHDFRRIYHVAYDEVPTDEAIDLIETLPDGSAYVSVIWPLRSWSREKRQWADVVDAVRELTWALAMDREKVPEPPRLLRPEHLEERAQAARRAARVRAELESDGWEEV